MPGKSIIIAGAGLAGLSAGCYAQMNDYRTRIFESHAAPGGLCTGWKRKVVTSLWIDRPPQDIWKYLCDVSNETKWREGVKSARWLSDPPYRVGSSGLHVIEAMGDWPWRVTEYKELHQMSWVATGGRYKGIHAGYGLVPEGTGSRMTIHVRVEHSDFLRIVMLFMRRRMRRQLAGDLERLKAIMEV